MLSGGQQIALYESGKLNIFKLTAESGVKGVRFEKAYFVFETEYPRLGQIKAHIWPGVKGVKLDTARGISLYESGSLESVLLVKDAKIAGIKYMGGEAGSDIYWYESGKIKHARLAEAQTIQGIPCAKDSNVEFSPKGILARAYLGKDAVIAGIRCAKDAETDIYETGALKITTLAEAQTIAGQLYAKGERLHFLKSGMVESTTAARDHYEHFSQATNDDQAMAAIEQAIAICPSYIEARTERVKIWIKRKDLNRAMSEIAAILQYDPGNLSAHVSSGMIHEDRGEADSTIADCNKALSIDPQCAVALKMRGDALMTQKKYSLALADLNKAVELSPDKEIYMNSLSWVLATCAESKYRNGQRAVELAEKSVRTRTGRTANNLDTLAAAYAEVGRFDDAVKIQQEVIKVAPKSHPELEDFNKRLDSYRQKKPWRQ
jgi:tetratricopeptide (TPR) repeat protein